MDLREMRVLVIGGRGFFGSRIVEEVRKLPAAEVAVAGRAGPLVVDLRDSTTFSAMNGFDYVINCTDSFAAPPDDALAYCLAGGITFLETSADAATIERLVLRFRDAAASTTGRSVLGVGLFPGVSNLAARAACVAHGGPVSDLAVGILLNPLSGGGRGLCALMAHAIARPSVYYADGKRAEDAAIGASRSLAFAGLERVVLGGRVFPSPCCFAKVRAYRTSRHSPPRCRVCSHRGSRSRPR